MLNIFFSVKPQSMPHSYQKQLLSELTVVHLFWNMLALCAWAPHTQKSISAIEVVQRCAARYVINNYSTYASVSEMFKHLQRTSLSD